MSINPKSITSHNADVDTNSSADGQIGSSGSSAVSFGPQVVTPSSSAANASPGSDSASSQVAFPSDPYSAFAAVSAGATAAIVSAVAPGGAGNGPLSEPPAPAPAPAPVAPPSPPPAPSVPSWVSGLHTASIAADMAAADVGGTVTEAGLVKLLTDLDSTLSSSKTSLTSAELSDLKTIVANLNNGMKTSAYLTNVMNSLVNGNADNATWTGGAPTSTALGNLAVGFSATKLSELTGEWLLGTDLPSTKVSVDGRSFSVSYSTSAEPLFATSGPSMSDVNQGALGDCYLLASLAEVANEDPGLISSMFTSNGNNTYGVRFYVDGVADYVTVNNSLANDVNSGADIWASLAEKAYTQLLPGDSYSTIANGGQVEVALEAITGASQITDFDALGGTWYDITYNSSMNFTGYSTSTTASVLSTLESDLAKGDDLVLQSYTNASSGGKTTLVADHAMSVYGIDASTGELEIRNPWGTESGQSWDTTFEVSVSTLLADGDVITADNVGTNTTTLKAPTTPSTGITEVGTASPSGSVSAAANLLIAAISSVPGTAASITTSMVAAASSHPITLANSHA